MSWRRFFRRRRWDQERARELQAYLDFEIDENTARGVSPEEARRAAHLKLGNPLLIREEIYRMNTMKFLESLWQDTRYGGRMLRLNPGFATVAVLSLALGIGANTAIFQLLDAIRIRTLPVKDPQQLVEVRLTPGSSISGRTSGRRPTLTNPQWELLRGYSEPFSGMFAWGNRRFNLASHGEGRYAEGMWVSGGLFEVLGVHPFLGRLFTVADDHRGCGAPGAVLSYTYWQRQFGGDRGALGKKLDLYGSPFEIIGVTPPSFFGLEVGRTFDIAVPICSEAVMAGPDTELDNRRSWWLSSVGRLKPGWTVERANTYVRTVSPAIFQATLPARYRADDIKNYLGFKLIAVPAQAGFSRLRGQYVNPLWMLLGIGGLVLLIACANLANLMLARAKAREREIAVRLAIGAGRGRLIRQLLIESLLLALAGAALGVVIARNLSRALVAFLTTPDNPVFMDLGLDWTVLGFTAGLTILTCVLFGLAPALRATRTTPGAALKAGGRGLTTDRERLGLRRILMVSQVALSLVLLMSALLFTRSLRNLFTIDLGFQPEGVLAVSTSVERPNSSAEQRLASHQELLNRIRGTAGVASAAETAIVPLSGNGWNEYVDARGSHSDKAPKPIVNFNRTSPGYFATMGTPLMSGRDFDTHDTLASPSVMIVNESFVRQLLNGVNPIGAVIGVLGDPSQPEPTYQIVGVVKDMKYLNVREEFGPIAYLPAAQEKQPDNEATFVIRSSAPEAAIPLLKRTIMDFDPEFKLHVRVPRTDIRDTLVQEQLMATLSGFFGFLAATLATIGLYGVMSYMVARRRNELGVRIALGAKPRAVVALVIREAAWLLAIGLAIGIGVGLAAGRTARSMLFGLQPNDPATMAMAVAILGAVALAASYLPARRAARLDPLVALREE